jgi:DNA sulfur modification protein DndD
LAAFNAKKIELGQKLESFNVDKVRKLQRERVSLESAKDTNLRRQGRAQTDLEAARKKGEALQAQLDKAVIEDERSKNLAYKSKFCNEAIQIITSTKNQLLDKIRQDIEDETNKKFFELIWKKKTFKCVKIDPNYNVSLISVDDIPMLGSVGKAENELLALAFMLALHNVSGFDSPILIDTPVARVSDEQRENFGKILIEISKEKQIILLFTNDEYSDNIKKIINPMASNQYAIEMSPDEMSTSIKVV